MHAPMKNNSPSYDLPAFVKTGTPIHVSHMLTKKNSTCHDVHARLRYACIVDHNTSSCSLCHAVDATLRYACIGNRNTASCSLLAHARSSLVSYSMWVRVCCNLASCFLLKQHNPCSYWEKRAWCNGISCSLCSASTYEEQLASLHHARFSQWQHALLLASKKMLSALHHTHAHKEQLTTLHHKEQLNDGSFFVSACIVQHNGLCLTIWVLLSWSVHGMTRWVVYHKHMWYMTWRAILYQSVHVITQRVVLHGRMRGAAEQNTTWRSATFWGLLAHIWGPK